MASFDFGPLNGGNTAGGTGAPIVVAATATPGTSVHKVPANCRDEIRIFGNNEDTSARVLALEIAGVGATYTKYYPLPPASAAATGTGDQLITEITLNANEEVKAWVASGASKVKLHGKYMRKS
ncbi:MAG: hypothetical protein V1806_03785 [Pseudomonadota bacterium]